MISNDDIKEQIKIILLFLTWPITCSLLLAVLEKMIEEHLLIEKLKKQL